MNLEKLKFDEIYLMDEIHTPDSSKVFFMLMDLMNDSKKVNIRKQLSKEFIALEWLIENNFMGRRDQTVPEMSAEWAPIQFPQHILNYMKQLLVKKFIPEDLSDDEIYKLYC